MSFWRKLVAFGIMWITTAYFASQFGIPLNLVTAFAYLPISAGVVVLLTKLEEAQKR